MVGETFDCEYQVEQASKEGRQSKLEIQCPKRPAFVLIYCIGSVQLLPVSNLYSSGSVVKPIRSEIRWFYQ